MSKSAIYTVNAAPTAVAAGDIVPLGKTVRRFGQDIWLDGNGITTACGGYYLVSVSATVAPTAAGAVTITGQKDGVAIIGATATSTAAAAATTDLAFTTLVRNACCDSSILSFVFTGAAATVSNFAVSIVKL